jgi:4-diphosphocytidyl-2-C-methyl-D-erythritol kinase
MQAERSQALADVPRALIEKAPAKINLTLRIVGRRADGYHDLESLVAFAEIGDRLRYSPGGQPALTVRGPTAQAAGAIADNIVLRAARALADQVRGLEIGRFALSKHLPVAAGLGGGSADAAAALRMLARANRLASDDPRLMLAACRTGADVPVCLDSLPRVMRGIGDILSDPVRLPRLPVVLVNPGVAMPTREVFAALILRPERQPAFPASLPADAADLVELIAAGRNDLEAPAIELQPRIAGVLVKLRSLPGCRLARMSGSGATCFALFGSGRAAASGARALRAEHADWWIRATALGGDGADSPPGP